MCMSGLYSVCLSVDIFVCTRRRSCLKLSSVLWCVLLCDVYQALKITCFTYLKSFYMTCKSWTYIYKCNIHCTCLFFSVSVCKYWKMTKIWLNNSLTVYGFLFPHSFDDSRTVNNGPAFDYFKHLRSLPPMVWQQGYMLYVTKWCLYRCLRG